MKRWLIPVAVLAALLVVAGAAFLLRENIANYWIKRQLAGTLARALAAEVDLQGVAWKDGILKVQRFRMAGGNHPFQRLEARDLRAPVDWEHLLDPSSRNLEIAIAEADLVWRSDDGPRDEPAAPSGDAPALPRLDLLVGKCHLRHADHRGWTVDGSQVRAVQNAGTWSLSAKGGSLAAEGRPLLQIERLSAENSGRGWNIGGFALKDAGDGVMAGSATNTGGLWSAEFSWQDLDLATLLTPNYAGHLGGKIAGDAALKDGVLSGKMQIDGGETKAVGLLVELADLIDGTEWNNLPWNIFRFNFTRREDGRLEFTDLQALSPKGLAVRGGGFYSPQSVGANLQVGVRAAGRPLLGAFVPVLFSHERDGYYWTQVKIGGTPAAPTENLGARLAAAVALAPAAGAAQSAVEIPAAASEAVGGLLREILRR